MEGAYLLVVVLLFVLAFADLIVGVSNDAVNFLNSAIGSKVASRRTILIIASVGILLGAAFSSGMMEVARKGVFNPSMFGMEEIMILFLAVMITDILLLDLFNSLALPTSTTVSIVFELLGAALILALIKSKSDPDHAILDYINAESALTIISGIFLSIGIAFTIGTLSQYLARFWFSFDFERHIPRYGGLFGGLAIASITYFVLIKGLKGSQLLPDEITEWIKSNTGFLLLGLFVGASILLQLLYSLFRVHPLRLVVLAGTFALAMAFAGNDLVNFIGVPITGFQAYQEWISLGSPDQMSMSFLLDPVLTPTYLLLIAGLIMVATLWFSGKARRVTETEVNLGRQDAGEERFKPNAISRGLVGSTLSLARLMGRKLPPSFLDKMEFRFKKLEKEDEMEADNTPAFDLVRASVNLMIASSLIAMASSLHLPLSTTYVSFMVAMGTSLADRAWGRESAVYRVAGVLNVIAGWFFTALIALLASGLMALVFYQFGLPSIIFMFVLAGVLLVRSHFVFSRAEKKRTETTESKVEEKQSISFILEDSRKDATESIHLVRRALRICIRELPEENEKIVLRVQHGLQDQKAHARIRQNKILSRLKKLDEHDLAAGRLYLIVQDLLQDIYQSGNLLTDQCTEFLKNKHIPPPTKTMEVLLTVERELTEFLQETEKAIKTSDYKSYSAIQKRKRKYMITVNAGLDNLLHQSMDSEVGKRAAQLSIAILLESKDIAAVSFRLLSLYKGIDTIEETNPVKGF